jgi:putative hydrolase of the HAD superfamily
MVGVKKPNRRIFDHALALAKADIDASLMIGDNLEADILGAKNMGMDALCFNYHKAKIPESIVVIDKLSELKQFL